MLGCATCVSACLGAAVRAAWLGFSPVRSLRQRHMFIVRLRNERGVCITFSTARHKLAVNSKPAVSDQIEIRNSPGIPIPDRA